eukprot:g12971.t1
MDILDVVLFDDLSAGEREAATSTSLESSTPFIGMRWLFTAKNGRVKKKSSHNTSLGALKQALLGRALICRGSSKGKNARANPTNERHSSSATGGGVFATALLRSGESVPLDEDTWTALVVKQGGREGGAVAVTALAPAGGDSGIETSHRGGAAPQRFTCEYSAKLHNRRTTLARANPVAATDFAVTAKPIEVSMATYVLVARGLLRDIDGRQSAPQHDQDEDKQAKGEAVETGTSAAETLLDERLLSRAKTTNREVEAKLRAVVHWVQETRIVYVLSMAATFIVVPSSGKAAGKPGVWLEQALHVRMVPKNGSAHAPAPPPVSRHAPIAKPPRKAPTDTQDPVAARGEKNRSGREEGGAMSQPSAATFAEDTEPPGRTTSTASAPSAPSASDTENTPSPPELWPLPPLPIPTGSDSVDELPETETHPKSTNEILYAAADAVLSASQNSGTPEKQVRPLRAADGAVTDTGQLQQESVSGAREPSHRPFAAATAHVKCSGDFCTYHGNGREGPGSLGRSPPKDSLQENSTSTVDPRSEAGSGEVKVEAGLDWTDISLSDDKSGAALLEVKNKRQGLSVPGDSEPGKDNGMLLSLTFKSVGLARVEAKQGRNAYWGEDLRRCWREGGCGSAGGWEQLNPGSMYQEEVLASIDATAASGRRAAAAEAGAVALRVEVAEILENVDARTGKLGIEAGKVWRKRLSKRRSSVGTKVSSGISQARLMDKLSQPKQSSLEEEQQGSMDSADIDRSARHPSLKRRVKSQGDIPESGFPLLPRRRRTGPASATSGRSAQERGTAGATRRTLLPGVPRRSAWPLQDDGVAMNTRRDVEKIHGGAGGGGDDVGNRSMASISAIEAMLEEGGGETYLPARARDLPEAVAILGPPIPGLSDDKPESGSRKGRPRGTRERRKEGSRYGGDLKNAKGQDDHTPENTISLDAPGENRFAEGNRETIDDDGRTGRTPSGASSGGRRCDGVEERFLHPWQRALEASKRAIKSRAEEHEAALLRDKRRRSEARRAAAASKDCQKARKRVAARLGRHKQRRHRRRRSAINGYHAERDKEQSPDLKFGRESTLFDIEEECGGSQDSLHGEGCPYRKARQHKPEDRDDPFRHDDCLHQMRDALCWARRTLTALEQRLRDRGIAVDNLAASMTGGEQTAKDWEVVRVVNKLRRRLAAFEDEGVTFGVERAAASAAARVRTKAGLAAASADSASSLLRSRCEATCESFETEFDSTIDELIAMAKLHPCNPNLQLSRFEGDNDGGSPLIAAGPGKVDSNQSANPSMPAPAAKFRKTTGDTASFGLCPSCSVLPVARRCLDCEGSHADRSRCSSCFVREHREAPRHLHRFLRVSGGSGVGGDRSGDDVDHAETKQHLGAQVRDNTRAGSQETRGNSSGVVPRCSRCGDLAAARRCRECRVDTCAACHFLAHRSPSRRSHVTEFVGETAIALQETLHSRNRHQSGAAAAATAAASGARRNGDRGEEGASRDGGTSGEGIVRTVTFGEDAAQSLAQVRRTIDPPVVRPRSQASKEVSGGRYDGDGGSRECGEEEDPLLSDESDSGGEILETGRSYMNSSADTFGSAGGAEAAGNNGSDSVCDDRKGKTEHMDGSSGWEEDTLRGGGDATAAATFVGVKGNHDDSCRSEGRRHRGVDHHRRGRRIGGVNYALEVLEGINEEDDEDGEDGSAGSSSCSSSGGDTEDEGMMWSPINIAKVGAEEGATSPPLPLQEAASPADVARTTVGTDEVFDTGKDLSPPGSEGDPVKSEGVETGRPEGTNDSATRVTGEGGLQAKDPSMTEQASSGAH